MQNISTKEHLNRPVIILTGPPGVGKTSTALLLREHLQPAASISINTIHHFISPKTLTKSQLRTTVLNVARMAIGYAGQGISCIIEGVIDDKIEVAKIELLLMRAGIKPYLFTLHAPLESVLERNDAGKIFYESNLELIKHLHDSFDWSLGTLIETRDKIIEVVVAEILEHLEQKSLRAGSELFSGSKERFVMFIRHGTANYTPGYYSKDSEVHLSLKGQAEAYAIADTARIFRPNHIICSNFARAVETGRIIEEKCGLPMELTDRFCERTFKSLYGKTIDEIKQLYSSSWLNSFISNPDKTLLPNEESVSECQKRVVTAFEEVLKQRRGRIIIVSHGGPHSWLCCHFLNLPLSQLRQFRLDNCRASVFRFDADGIFKQIMALNVSDLPEELVTP